MIRTLFIFAGSLAFSFSAFAISVKDCPSELTVTMGQPDKLKNYAKHAVENYFLSAGPVLQELTLESSADSQCTYSPKVEAGAKINHAVIRGSLRQGAKDAATLVVYTQLPVDNAGSEIDLSSLVIYGKIATLSRHGISFTGPGEMYRIGEMCDQGECIADYVYIGLLNQLQVSAKP